MSEFILNIFLYGGAIVAVVVAIWALGQAVSIVEGIFKAIAWVWMETCGGRRRQQARIQRGWDDLPDWFERRRARQEADIAYKAGQKAAADRIKAGVASLFR